MYVRGQCVRAMETASIRDTQKGRQGRMSRGARRTRGREGILRMGGRWWGGVFFYMVVLVWRLFGRGAQGSACLDFSLSLRTGTLIRIGPGSYPGKGGVLSDHYLRKKKEKGGERSKKERRTAVAQQEMLTASLIYMQVQGEWGGAYSVSNLHVKCWPGQLMGMRGIVRPMLLFPLSITPIPASLSLWH